MARIYSGATKAEVAPLKTRFFPVTYATDLTTHPAADDFCGGKIDAEPEQANICFECPVPYARIKTAELVVIPLEDALIMYIDISIKYAQIGEPYNTHWYTGAFPVANVTTDELTTIDIRDYFIAVEQDDYFGLKARYSATATATNMLVLGLRMTYY